MLCTMYKARTILPLIDHDVELLALFDKEVQRPNGRPQNETLYNIQGNEHAPSGTSRQAAVVLSVT